MYIDIGEMLLHWPLDSLCCDYMVRLSRVKKEAAPGRDGISFRMMTAAGLRDLWLALFGTCWRSGLIPSEWRRSLVVPVPKKQCGGVCLWLIDLEELH